MRQLGLITITAFLFISCMQTDVLMLDPAISYTPTDRVALLFSEEDASENLLPIAIIEVTSPALGNHSQTRILETLRDKAQEIGADAVYIISTDQQYIPPTYTQNIDGSLLTIPGGQERRIIGIALRDTDNVWEESQSQMQLRSGPRFGGGASFNVLAPVLGGYGVSGWLGKNRFRGVIDYYSVDIPAAMSRDGFNDGRVENAVRLSFDYFFLGNLKGPYFGTGFQYASYSSGHENTTERGEWESLDFNASFGYKLNLLPNIHLDARVALDAMIYGEEDIMVGNNRMVPDDAKIYGLIGFGVHF